MRQVAAGALVTAAVAALGVGFLPAPARAQAQLRCAEKPSNVHAAQPGASVPFADLGGAAGPALSSGRLIRAAWAATGRPGRGGRASSTRTASPPSARGDSEPVVRRGA